MMDMLLAKLHQTAQPCGKNDQHDNMINVLSTHFKGSGRVTV